jgi:hypothetical protein
MRKLYLIYPTIFLQYIILLIFFCHFQFLATALHSCVRWRSEHFPNATFSGWQTCCEWLYFWHLKKYQYHNTSCLMIGQFGSVPKIEAFRRKKMSSLACIDRRNSITFSVVSDFVNTEHHASFQNESVLSDTDPLVKIFFSVQSPKHLH